tara:strand:+ start:387 stop:671 length:285 start_codon:yes stop_codon:yes gene_type:complete
MAITKEVTNDKIEIVGDYKAVQIRQASIIKEDGKELTRSFHRRILWPGTLDASNNLVDTNLSSEDADVKAICEAVWSDQIKADYKAFLIANKSH